jgi:WD40 repeat protein
MFSSLLNKRIAVVLILALCTVVGRADDESLPARSFQRIGTSKLRHGSQILCLAYTQDGKFLAAGGGNDPLRLWDPKTGALIKELNETWVQAIAFTASGETMVYASLQKNIRLWNFTRQVETGKLEGHKAPIKAIAVSPDSTVIASGSQDGAIYLWNLETKRKIGELPGHLDEVTALVYTPDSSFLISAGSDHFIHLWNAETNMVKLKIDGGCGVLALAVSADSKTLYSAGDDALIRRWDLATGKQTGTFKGHEGLIVSLALRLDNLFSGGLDGTIRVWDAKTTKLLNTLPRRRGDCSALAVTPQGDFVATAGTNNTIRIFAMATGKEVLPGTGPQAGLNNLQLSPDHKRLASVTTAGDVYVFEAQSGKTLSHWNCGRTGEIMLADAPNGKTLATAAGDDVRFWDAATGAAVGDPLPVAKGAGSFVALAFSPDSKTLALGRRQAPQVELWDLDQKKMVKSLKYDGAVHAIAWSPNGKTVAAAGMAKIMFWDAQTGNLTMSFDVREGPPPIFPLVTALAFGPDGRTLAAACIENATIRVYDLFSKNPTSAEQHRTCVGHESMVYALAFSADGRTLVSGSADKSARLWEAFSGKPIANFKGHIGSVMGVAFAADGRSVYTASADTSILRWDVPGLTGKGSLPDLTLTVNELNDAWKMLTSEDTPRGHEAMWRCVASAKQAVPDLAKKMYLLDPDHVKKLFRDLDSNHYGTRMTAMGELSNYGRWMEGRYLTAMNNPPSLEYKRRVETLRDKLQAANSPSLAQERLRVRRFMFLCEQVGDAAAIEALQKLADKGPEEEIQEEAKSSLQRLKAKSRS